MNYVNIKKPAPIFMSSFRVFLYNGAVCCSRCGVCAECCISVSPLYAEVKLQLKIEHSLERSGEPSWQPVCIVPVPSACRIDCICLCKCQKRLQSYSRIHCNFWDMRGSGCRCTVTAQLPILLLFRGHRSLYNKVC